MTIWKIISTYVLHRWFEDCPRILPSTHRWDDDSLQCILRFFRMCDCSKDSCTFHWYMPAVSDIQDQSYTQVLELKSLIKKSFLDKENSLLKALFEAAKMSWHFWKVILYSQITCNRMINNKKFEENRNVIVFSMLKMGWIV